MKKIALSLMTIAAVAVMVVGATQAYFTSGSVAGTTQAGSGTLAVNAAKGGAYNAAPINIANLKPGDITGEATYTVKNVGSMDAATFSRFTIADDSGLSGALKFYEYKVEYFKANGSPANRWTNNTDGYFGTSSNVDWFIKDGDASRFIAAGGKTTLYDWVTGSGPLDIMGTAWDIEGLPTGAYYVVKVKFQMDPAAGNWYQNKSVKIGFEAQATQLDDGALTAFGYPGQFTYLSTNANTYR